jgi:hypothetical protein
MYGVLWMNSVRDRSASVVVDPDPSRLAQQITDHYHRALETPDVLAFRAQLCLPTDRPIVMTGHQPTWWHAGILAKYIACDALASCLDAAPAWIVPDQDEVAFSDIALPVRTATGDLERLTVNLTPASPLGTPIAFAPSFTPNLPIDSVEGVAAESVLAGLASLRDSLLVYSSDPTGVRQVCNVLTELMTPVVGPAPTLFASELHKTDLFQSLLEQMRNDPSGATQAYNAAVARHPDAHMAPLVRLPEQDQYELPLWRLTPGQPRQAVYSSQLNDIPLSELAPKALLMTGLLRLGACDVFIHGTGGGAYDRVTEEWLRDWLGVELAPMLVVSATLTLPLDDEAPTPEEVSAAAWTARHALHHPRMIGLDELQAKRDELVEQIAQQKESNGDPAASFTKLHDLLEEYRSAHREELGKLEERAALLRSKSEQSDIAHDRTWPFFSHEESALRSLAQEIRAALCLNAEEPQPVSQRSP